MGGAQRGANPSHPVPPPVTSWRPSLLDLGRSFGLWRLAAERPSAFRLDPDQPNHSCATADDDPLQAGGGLKAEALTDRGGNNGLSARGDRASHRVNDWRSCPPGDSGWSRSSASEPAGAGGEAGLGVVAVAAGQRRQIKVVAGLAPPGSGSRLAHGSGWRRIAWARIARPWGEGELPIACQRS